MRSKMLALTMAFRQSLIDNVPSLIDEVNALELDPLGNPYPAVVYPLPARGSTAIVALGIRTDMLTRPIEELPAMACGVYLRTPIMEGEQLYSEVVFPFTIDVYLGGTNADDLYIISLKWGLVLDLWQERYGDLVIPGYSTEEAPDLDVSYTLNQRGDEFRQLVTATGVFTTHE